MLNATRGGDFAHFSFHHFFVVYKDRDVTKIQFSSNMDLCALYRTDINDVEIKPALPPVEEEVQQSSTGCSIGSSISAFISLRKAVYLQKNAA